MSTQNPLVKDGGNHEAVQIANSFQTFAPISFTVATTALTVPAGAVEFIVAPTTDLKVSDDNTFTRYDKVVAGTKEAFGCARMTTIYITRSGGDGTAYGRWTIV